MDINVCCFAGHKLLPRDEIALLEQTLNEQIRQLIRQGVTDFLTGGVPGFDTIAALTVLRLKKEFPQIRLILYLPCRGLEQTGSVEEATVFRLIFDRADQVVYLSEHYHKDCFYKRSRAMVAQSGYCLCYLTKRTGATSYTVAHAKNQGLHIMNCKDKEKAGS